MTTVNSTLALFVGLLITVPIVLIAAHAWRGRFTMAPVYAVAGIVTILIWQLMQYGWWVEIGPRHLNAAHLAVVPALCAGAAIIYAMDGVLATRAYAVVVGVAGIMGSLFTRFYAELAEVVLLPTGFQIAQQTQIGSLLGLLAAIAIAATSYEALSRAPIRRPLALAIAVILGCVAELLVRSFTSYGIVLGALGAQNELFEYLICSVPAASMAFVYSTLVGRQFGLLPARPLSDLLSVWRRAELELQEVRGDILNANRRIAELQRLNVELDEAKRIKEQLIMQSPLAIIQTDLAANIEDVNPAGQQLFARSLDQLLGTRVQRYLGHWDRALPELRQLADNDRGRTVQVFPGAQPERIADLMVTFLRSPTAELIGYYITLNDVTESIRERHRRELEDKVQGIHRTSRVIAHDFSHLLIGIRGAIERARSTGASDDLGLAYDAAVSGVQRGQDMLRQMGAGQAFAKPKLAVTSLNAIVSEAVQIYRAAALDRSIEVTFDDVDDVLVNVDPAQMVRVFTNLLGNAMRVVPVGGRVRIEFVPEKYGVTAKVIDNGPGMTLKQIEQAIDPGFSTKGEGSGGLGLAISYLMVEAHGGRFAIEAVPEGGLAALVWLPIATEMDMQSDRSDARLIVHLRDSVLAESVVAAWERQGASAVETRSNEEVNALLKDEAEHWDTLLSDSDELPRARHCTSFQLHGNTLQLTRPGERTEDECERLRQQIEISAFGRMRH